MKRLLLSALLVASASVCAADQAKPYVQKFDAPTPDKLPATRAEVTMPLPVRIAPAPAQSAAAAPTTVAPAPAVAVPTGLPMIPASDPNNHAKVPQPTVTPTSSNGLVPGQPVATYATMAQAAEAGIDPLNERKPATSTPAAASAPAPVVTTTGFDVKNPASWLAWAKSHREEAFKFGFGALAVLVVGVVLGRIRARRNTQE